MRPRPRARAFSLVELLVVISIIAILAGLALPALSGAMNSAKKAKANAMINQLKVAITAFNTEYGTWPLTGAGTDVTVGPNNASTTTLYQVLTATEGATPTYNTRNIVFMEFNTADLDNSANPTMFVDPWYKTGGQQATQGYILWLDGNYDNQLSVPDITQTTGSTTAGVVTINAGVAIGDPGPTISNKVNTTNPSKMLHSW